MPWDTLLDRLQIDQKSVLGGINIRCVCKNLLGCRSRGSSRTLYAEKVIYKGSSSERPRHQAGPRLYSTAKAAHMLNAVI